MKIKHNLHILEDWVTIEWQILETIFEWDEKRWDCIRHFSNNKNFYIASDSCPELFNDSLYVFWINEEDDGLMVKRTYKSGGEAQQAMERINEFTIKDTSAYNPDLTLEEYLELNTFLNKEGVQYINRLLHNRYKLWQQIK